VTLSLTEEYPGTTALPRVALCDLPTPLEDGIDLPPGDEAEQHRPVREMLVKRDDLTSTRYGGNKVRKLEFLLGQARAEERDAVLTFGAYGSNHALATAVHARALGIEPHVVLSPQAPGPFAARTLRAHAGLGTVIHLAEGWDGTREAVRVRRELRERGSDPLVIPMGGTNAVGAIGYVNAAFEISAQMRDAGRELTGAAPGVSYVPGGTLGTAIGLAVGFAAVARMDKRSATRVVAVRVTPGEVANEPFARALTTETVALLRSLDATFPDVGYDDLAFELRDEFFEPGYGVPTPDTVTAVELAAARGLKLETTYTGKALFAMLADVDSGRLSPDSEPVLFWDTYNSAPYPPAGPDEALPAVLREYVAECDRLFGGPGSGMEATT